MGILSYLLSYLYPSPTAKEDTLVDDLSENHQGRPNIAFADPPYISMDPEVEHHVSFRPNGPQVITIDLPRTVRDTALEHSLITARSLEAHSNLIRPLTPHETATDQTGRNYILTGTVTGRWSLQKAVRSYPETFYVTGSLRAGLDALLQANTSCVKPQSSRASDGYILEDDPRDKDRDQSSNDKHKAKDKERQDSKDKESQKNIDKLRQLEKGGGSGGGARGSASGRVVSKGYSDHRSHY
ncbi:hypothetical protein PV05_04232 [Exophiala xenobiotica]|uniref:Uncharacterized protein n=1 Tax=Exophiala xenobiotica TaxID=348802 RepID=A0A0D2EJD0_9EURO|nr:uncharacterized protein PV05_04232 [Exophiala xenobiotica]KIW55493.1 hypothetical protein PV05_04232 [Exophiala xenobiotica]